MRLRNYLSKHLFSLAIVITSPIITFLLVGKIVSGPVNTVQAVGDVTITYNNTGPEEPVFSVFNMLPGDCTEKVIEVENAGMDPVLFSVWSQNEAETKNLPQIILLTISENNSSLYINALRNFFTESDVFGGIPLSTVGANELRTFTFTLCMSENATNDFQNGETSFDLVFGMNFDDNPLPPECSHLAGKIVNVIEGTDGDDRIRGTRASELILGYGGDDKIDGKHGDDCIVGGQGDDDIEGGTDNDVILGGAGNDKLRGGSQNDIVYGGEGSDDIDGGAGDDILYGDGGDDEIDGSSGVDRIYGGDGFDELDGGARDDTCNEGEDYNSCELIL